MPAGLPPKGLGVWPRRDQSRPVSGAHSLHVLRSVRHHVVARTRAARRIGQGRSRGAGGAQRTRLGGSEDSPTLDRVMARIGHDGVHFRKTPAWATGRATPSAIRGRRAWRAGHGAPRLRGSLSPLPRFLHLSTDALAPAVSHRISGGVGHFRGQPRSHRPRHRLPETVAGHTTPA